MLSGWEARGGVTQLPQSPRAPELRTVAQSAPHALGWKKGEGIAQVHSQGARCCFTTGAGNAPFT